MTFTDEVLDRAWQARIERETAVRDRLGLDSAPESAEANAAGLAAMRAVLEGHLAAQGHLYLCCAQCPMFVALPLVKVYRGVSMCPDCYERAERLALAPCLSTGAASDGSPR